jgi:hypothetical protein
MDCQVDAQAHLLLSVPRHRAPRRSEVVGPHYVGARQDPNQLAGVAPAYNRQAADVSHAHAPERHADRFVGERGQQLVRTDLPHARLQARALLVAALEIAQSDNADQASFGVDDRHAVMVRQGEGVVGLTQGGRFLKRTRDRRHRLRNGQRIKYIDISAALKADAVSGQAKQTAAPPRRPTRTAAPPKTTDSGG